MAPPASTYRLQLHKAFGFPEVRALLPYFEKLGVDALYLSPIFAAEPGSTHGYDVIDPSLVNPELGGEEELIRLAEAAKKRGLQILVDFVPNHMGVASHHNAAWDDLLENGLSALAADTFDVDWEALGGKVLLPILGDNYGTVLERGDIALRRQGGRIYITIYGQRELPIAPRALAPLLERAAAHVPVCDAQTELLSIATALRNLPDRDETAPERKEERAREKEVAKKRLAALCSTAAEIAEAIDHELQALNGRPGESKTFDQLHELLDQQVYRLSNWRVALESINYRRFFDVDHLAAVRMEEPEVFERCHGKLLELVQRGVIQGVRLDHIDGLYDPTDYLKKLRGRVGEDTYIVVEKIVEEGERLPPEWPIQGTTGYEFATLSSGVFIDPNAKAQLSAFYRRFTRNEMSFEDRAVACKRLILQNALASELQILGRHLYALAQSDRVHRDLTLGALVTALTEVIANFPVYRTYIRPDGSRQPQDDAHIAHALARARQRNRSSSAAGYDFLERTLRQRELSSEAARFIMRFQQLTGPAMAKAVEDTAFYVHNCFIALNEVGGNPDKFGITPQEFHAANLERRRTHPLCMTTTSTHDTKRGEDARARLAVLSERPEAWQRAVARWTKVAKPFDPDPNDEYLFYQALIGAFPFNGESAGLKERMQGYMLKAAKEAKTHTSWINPNLDYERALESFVTGMLDNADFVADVRSFCDEHINDRAAANVLGQVVLRMCSPGVPDIYNGSELWNQSLVDPDNRLPVRFGELSFKDPMRMWQNYKDGRIKAFVIQQLLHLRKKERELFLYGDYTPLDLGEGFIAFRRGDRLTVVVSRFGGAEPPRLLGRDVITGLKEMKLPVAVFLA